LDFRHVFAQARQVLRPSLAAGTRRRFIDTIFLLEELVDVGLLGTRAYSTRWLHVSSLINTFFALGGGQNHCQGQNREVLHVERSEMAFAVLGYYCRELKILGGLEFRYNSKVNLRRAFYTSSVSSISCTLHHPYYIYIVGVSQINELSAVKSLSDAGLKLLMLL
jgi:hypothetical protein